MTDKERSFLTPAIRGKVQWHIDRLRPNRESSLGDYAKAIAHKVATEHVGQHSADFREAYSQIETFTLVALNTRFA